MKFKELVDETVKSGITPIRLTYDRMNSFATGKAILRSFMVVESLDLGTLTYREYRFVARRTKQGNAMIRRHIEKLFRAYTHEPPDADALECISIPVYARLLKGGELAEMLMEAFASFPEVPPSKICIELSADILYEDIKEAKSRLKDLRDMGLKLAICEVGDEFCPVFRLSELSFDYAFADEFATASLSADDYERVAGSLVSFLHLLNVAVYAPGLDSEAALDAARLVGFDGYGMNESLSNYDELGGDGA